MVIKYEILVTIINLSDGTTDKFSKILESEINKEDKKLYNNYHVLSESLYILDVFKNEINGYLKKHELKEESIEIDEFEIVSLTDKADVFFEGPEGNDDGPLSLRPRLKTYIHPKNSELKIPELKGEAYDQSTIIWSWPDDMEYAHYLVEEKEADDPSKEESSQRIIAQLPIGIKNYVETNLNSDTAYTRRLINYTEEQTSVPSKSVTVRTETVNPSYSIEDYRIEKNHDFSMDESDREIIENKLEAFHSGIGDFNDLKVYKQMDSDFYQKFKTYFEIKGRRFRKEKRYDQIGFNYKLCLEAKEEIEEQEGEVTFDVEAYPREWVALEDYMWATAPAIIKTRVQADIFLRKDMEMEEAVEERLHRPKLQHKTKKITSWDKVAMIISIDCSMSMLEKNSEGLTRIHRVKEAAKKLITKFSEKLSKASSDKEDGPERYIVCLWAGDYVIHSFKKKKEVEDYINSITIKQSDNRIVKTASAIHKGKIEYIINTVNNKSSDATNFYMGMTKPVEFLNKNSKGIDNALMLFFTDGDSTQAYPVGPDAEYIRKRNNGYWEGIPTQVTYAPLNGKKDNYGKNDFKWKYLKNSRKIDNILKEVKGLHYRVVNKEFNNVIAKNIISQIREGFNIILNNPIEISCNFVSATGKTVDLSNFPADSNNTSNMRALKKFFKNEMRKTVQEFDGKIASMSWSVDGSINQISKVFEEIINNLKTEEIIDQGYKFKGWEEYTVPSPAIKRYNLDYVKAVKITTELFDFAFIDNPSHIAGIPGIKYGTTPSRYIEKEKRAIVPEDSFMFKTNLSDKNLYNIILDAAKQTKEWKDGYNQTIGTIEDGSSPDRFLVTNLYIQKKIMYSKASADLVNNLNFEVGGYDNGLDGSVNVFAEIDKIDTKYYKGDNDGAPCYLIEDSDKSKLMIQGYTDAIIYDYTQYIREELNKYDRESAIIIGPSVTDKTKLVNRRDKNMTYAMIGGDYGVAHAVELKEKDEDIFFDNNMFTYIGQQMVFNPITTDVTARINKFYISPVLNYRFSLEDPDAKTPLYEIMPDCNPNNKFLHVVKLNVYYAKNIWIININNYHGEPEPWMKIISSHGDKCLGIIGTDQQGRNILQQGVYQWSNKEWQHGTGTDNGWYIDNFVWFMAKKILKIRDYYDELPGKGIDTFYGLVNGRYKNDNQNGKDDLTVVAPKFNIPTTVTEKHSDSIRIYCMITETNPDTGLVSYRWETPYNNIDSVTQKNGDYIYFSSDSMHYKDVEYTDIISTINFENQELFDSKTVEKIYQVKKPESEYEYKNYYLEVKTDNSDVIAVNYPTEIEFDENGNAEIGVRLKGVVNATSKWSPRIHNGYYYLNQHEYYAYSEFEAEANFVTYEESNYKTANGYVSIETKLRKPAKPKENYSIKKETRSELLQDEKKFKWINGKGLTLKPEIEGKYYKEYGEYEYLSPKITFKNKLTSAGPLKVSMKFDDVDDANIYVPMYIRYYDTEKLEWSVWEPFINGNAPTELSNAYQLRFNLEASVTHFDKKEEDYLCCYLDWKEDGSEFSDNIVTITDYMTTETDNGTGTYISKIFDYGCQSDIKLSIFESNYKDRCKLYIASSDTEDGLSLESITWIGPSGANGADTIKSRFFRYKIEIPGGEKVYWLHKLVNTKETKADLPYITGITMTGEYKPEDVTGSFIVTESFELTKDDKYHEIIPDILKLIEAGVTSRGFLKKHIENVNITCTTPDIELKYDKNITVKYPGDKLNSSVEAKTKADVGTLLKKTPYIRADIKDALTDENKDIETVTIRKATPQQYSPVTVEDESGNTYTYLKDCNTLMYMTEHFEINEPDNYITLKRNDYEKATVKVYVNEKLLEENKYIVKNHIIIFNNYLDYNDKITVEYRVANSFYYRADRIKDETVIYIYTDINRCNINNLPETPVDKLNKYKIYFETGKINNKFIAGELSINPIYRTDYKGFIYLTDEHNEPASIKVYCNPLRLKSGGYDRVDIQAEILDIKGNPVPYKKAYYDCKNGILSCKENKTDMNGVIHMIYESSVLPSKDVITVRVTDDNDKVIESSITIINE